MIKTFSRRMHSVIALLGLVALIALLTGCATSQATNPTSTQDLSTANNAATPVNGQGKGSATGQGQAGQGTGPASTVNYKGVTITIVSVDQQKQYTDDAASASPVVLRVNIHEQNTMAQDVYISYSEAARLILPDGSSYAPNTNAPGVIGRAIVRTSWLDFPLQSKQDVNKLILRLGTTSERQMDIPLSHNPDLTKYQAKSITPNLKVHYGIDWTVTKVISSLNADGEQADAGKRYIIIELKADNKTADPFYPVPANNFRLKSNTVIQSPKDTTVPGNIAPNSTGTIGTVTFLMPENDSNFQLQFLAQPTEKINATYANFQI